MSRTADAVQPVFGHRARAAARLPVGGNKRRKVLVLIAAYADAGEPSPSIGELAARVRLDRMVVCQVVKRLADDGLIQVDWRGGRERRNAYRLPPASAGGRA